MLLAEGIRPALEIRSSTHVVKDPEIPRLLSRFPVVSVLVGAESFEEESLAYYSKRREKDEYINFMKIMKDNELERLENILKKAGLPTKMPELAPDKLLEAMQHDKKVVGGKIRFALPKRIGDAFITDDVSTSIIKKALVN